MWLQALHASGHANVRARRSAAAHADSDADTFDEDDDEFEGTAVQLPLKGDMLVDPWAIEADDPATALCAVCGDGDSPDGNQVIFCERCAVPVHQHCYGVETVPEGDWLCWPCLLCAPAAPVVCQFACLHCLVREGAQGHVTAPPEASLHTTLQCKLPCCIRIEHT